MVPAILMFAEPINIKIIIPKRQAILQTVAIKEAPLGSILNFFTKNPPVTIPTHAPGIATPPKVKF